MNSGNTNTRRRAILVALVVALVGLTIAPGFKCTHEKNADGSEKTVVEA